MKIPGEDLFFHSTFKKVGEVLHLYIQIYTLLWGLKSEVAHSDYQWEKHSLNDFQLTFFVLNFKNS